MEGCVMATATEAKLTIDPEFESLCPPLTPMEFTQLEQNIIKDGCREPILVWANHDDTILDGHNRYKICGENQTAFKIKALKFDTREEAKQWIITNQLGRRNLTAEQSSVLRGMKYNARKQAQGGDRKSEESKDQNDLLISTAEQLAEEFKVGEATIKRDGKFAEAVETITENCGHEARKLILDRDVKASRADVQKLAALKPKEQKAAVAKIQNGQAKNVRDAVALVAPQSDGGRSPAAPAYPLSEWFNKRYLKDICAGLSLIRQDFGSIVAFFESDRFDPDGIEFAEQIIDSLGKSFTEFAQEIERGR
jgi:hypothetical protein